MSQIESRQSYADVTFKRVDLQNETITAAEFSDCQFTGCDFSDTFFQNCRFIDCAFKDCTMRMTRVEDSTLAGVQFSQCNLMGVNWTEANWSEWVTKLNGINFEGCNLKYDVFFGLEFKNFIMKDCNAQEANFAEADLTDADFSGTDFTEAVFLRTTLNGANFVGAKNYGFSLNDNPSKGAKFALPEATRLLRHLDIVLVE